MGFLLVPSSAPAVGVTPATPPDAPGLLTVTPQRSGANVSWTVPADNGAPISSYMVTALSVDGPGNSSLTDIDVEGDAAPGTPMSYSFTRLNNHTTYRIIVTAMNAAGQGPEAAVDDVAPRGVPDAPGTLAAITGNRKVAVTWSAPADDGGWPITEYTVTLAPPSGGTPLIQVLAPTATNASFADLTNGTSYAVSVVATNALGDSPKAVSVATPATVPGAATSVSATRGNGRATVKWSAPVSNGGNQVTAYRVTASPGGRTTTVGATARNLVFAGLTNGTRYTFTVAATNAKGAGPASASSTGVVPAGPPARMTTPAASAGKKLATVAWRSPGANGSAITRFQVRCSNGVTKTVAGSVRSLKFTGLSTGKRLSFQVRAINAVGTGYYSAASAIVKIK